MSGSHRRSLSRDHPEGMGSRGQRMNEQFFGWIAGAGSTSGTRLVLGHWATSPFGTFSDVMVAHPDGRRELLAPTQPIAQFVTDTYRFDTLTICDVAVHRSGGSAAGSQWQVSAGPLTWSFTVGPRRNIGWLLKAVPQRLATSRGFARLTDPVARVVMPGVRTIGRAGGPDDPRLEWYAGRDLHRIVASAASWDGQDLGGLAPVTPPPRFGFSGTPTTPSLTKVVSTVAEH